MGYSLNRGHLLADAVIAIATAKQRLLERVQAEIATWDPQPVSVWLFGSAARNVMRLESDIDLLIVTPGPTEQLDEQICILAEHVQQWAGNACSPLIYTAKEVVDAKIFHEVLKDGVCLVGERSWLRKKLVRLG